MKVWHKILVAPAVAIAFLLALGGVSYAMLARQNAALEELAGHRLASFQAAADAAQGLAGVHAGIYRLFTWIAALPPEQVAKAKQEQQRKLDAVARSLAQLRSNALSTDEAKTLDGVLPQLANYRKLMDDAITAAAADPGSGAAAMQTTDDQFQAIGKDMDAFVDLEKHLAKASHDTAVAEFRQTLTWLAAIVALAAAAAFGVALAMSRGIVRPLNDAIGVADRIAAGDLSGDIRVRSNDETGQLLQALSLMLLNLRDLAGQVAGGARAVADTSSQIAQGNLDLSQRTEEQASTLQETATSMQELTSTVAQNADIAREASGLAVNASDVARKGGAVVGQVVSTMTGISDASRKIADIIGVIDGIAFQTNILALNAAVEAARAGEQGRGFAVVAAEVRSLAQRSAEAAKEIKGLINDSVAKVDEGTRLVDDAGRTMGEIVASVKKVSDLIKEIAAASMEQDAGIGQVNTAIASMEQVVQENASLVEQASAATESMNQQAGALLKTVSRFKLQARPQESAVEPVAKPESESQALKPEATTAWALTVPVENRLAPEPATPPVFAQLEPQLAGAGEWKEF